jgi:hypothetical protein
VALAEHFAILIACDLPEQMSYVTSHEMSAGKSEIHSFDRPARLKELAEAKPVAEERQVSEAPGLPVRRTI